jgi:predicted dienelactone hydrolase
MVFDPSARGRFSVATREGVAIDRARDGRTLPFAVWCPDAADGPLPLVLHSHSSGGGRRQSSFLCEHLASHGYVVAAADHVGNTAADFAASAARAAAGVQSTPAEREANLRRIIADRVPDLRFLLDQLLSGAAGDVVIDDQRIGLAGWSFGGWAVLATPEVDDRVRAIAALAPAGNSKPLPGIIPATLTFEWQREVPTLFLAAERDQFIPLDGIRELFERTPSRKRLFILRSADHSHFADDVGDETLCSREEAHRFTRALVLAHFQSILRGDEAARRFLDDDPEGMLRMHGVDAIG